MLNNFYTLYHLSKEFKSLIGNKVIEIFSQEKDTIVFNFFDGLKSKYLYFSAKNNFSFLYLDSEYKRARQNTVDLMEQLVGDVLQDVTLENAERIFLFRFINFQLYFHIFSGSSSNLYLCDKNNHIKFKLNKPSDNKSEIYSRPSNTLIPFNEYPSGELLTRALIKSNELFTKFYTEELLTRCNIDASIRLYQLSEINKHYISIQIEKIKNELYNTKTFYIIQTENEPILSLIKLSRYPNILFEYNEISQAIKKCKTLIIKRKIINALKTELTDIVQKNIKKYATKINNYKENLKNSVLADTYNLIGNLLLSQPDLRKKGLSSITIDNYDGGKILVKLDPKLNILENAQRYFEKSKKIVKNINAVKLNINKYNFLYKYLNNLLIKLSNINDYKLLISVRKELIQLKLIKDNYYIDNNLENKFKKFELSKGFLLYVGKNSINNEELTFKFAKPNDLWLHAKGFSGAHAVIPLSKNQVVPIEVIEKAAEITAYYSNARNASYVPVCYTQRKYVKKVKKATPGTVIVAREKVIFVAPKIDKNYVPQL